MREQLVSDKEALLAVQDDLRSEMQEKVGRRTTTLYCHSCLMLHC